MAYYVESNDFVIYATVCYVILTDTLRLRTDTTVWSVGVNKR